MNKLLSKETQLKCNKKNIYYLKSKLENFAKICEHLSKIKIKIDNNILEKFHLKFVNSKSVLSKFKSVFELECEKERCFL